MSLSRFLNRPEFSALFASAGAPQAIDCGGCAPPVIVETDRQADQRIADELRDERYRSTLRNPPATDTGD